MKGLMSRKQFEKIHQEDYSLYTYLVARHMWWVIKRRIAKLPADVYPCVPDMKALIALKYDVDWIYDCWLCSEHMKHCFKCPLCSPDYEPSGRKSGCGYKNSPYQYATSRNVPTNVRLAACDDIIEAIDKEAKRDGII